MALTKTKSRVKKRLMMVLLMVFSFYTIVEITNRNTTNMTIRQKVLKTVYPLLMWFSGKSGNSQRELVNKQTEAAVPFYTLQAEANDGSVFEFEQLRGKKILLVNTASDCGYTGQYDDLQKLSEQYAGRLVVIGFPANDFKEQERGSDKEIAEFCRVNFGVRFPLMKKSSVVKGPQQNKVFDWLSDPAKNGWNSKQPSWNFCKYIVDENGRLTHIFGPSVEPLGKEISDAVNQ